MSVEFSIELLRSAVSGSAAAFRSITELQPVEGVGGKIFPATYAKGVYATERRRLRDDGGSEREVDCVLLNSVQSEANHAEEALKRAVERRQIQLPMIEVDFQAANGRFKQDMANLTSLDVPHRLADAILRDSELADGTRFSKSEFSSRWARANLWNATPIFELCPTALLFGMWGSPEKPGGLGAKFERAFVSEIVAVDVVDLKPPMRMGFRIDPLGAQKKVMVSQSADGGFKVLGDSKDKNALKPSQINHGNIPFETPNGGLRCRFAEQATVISLGALRKLRFPINDKSNADADDAARTLLAALGLCAAALAAERGTSLRSRCTLFPTQPRSWQLIDKPGQQPQELVIDASQACAVLGQAIRSAKAAGLPWMEERLMLRPTPELVELVRQSQELAAKDKGEGEAE